MMIVKEMSTGKRLDEACNHNNDEYGDEVLYTEWARLPSVGTALREFTSTAGATTNSGYAALAKLFYSVRD